jgi:hypothetical protein
MKRQRKYFRICYNPDMLKTEQTKYVHDRISLGATRDTLIKELTRNKWSKEEIDEALNIKMIHTKKLSFFSRLSFSFLGSLIISLIYSSRLVPGYYSTLYPPTTDFFTWFIAFFHISFSVLVIAPFIIFFLLSLIKSKNKLHLKNNPAPLNVLLIGSFVAYIAAMLFGVPILLLMSAWR